MPMAGSRSDLSISKAIANRRSARVDIFAFTKMFSNPNEVRVRDLNAAVLRLSEAKGSRGMK